MSIIHWIGSAGGSFGNTKNWNPQLLPGASDDALIDLSGDYVVDATGSFGVHTLALAAGATLDVNGSFAIAAGSAPGGIAGTIDVGNGSALDLGGVFALSGTVDLNAAGAATALVLTSSTLTLSGGGHIVLSDDAANEITGTSGDTLVNNGVTISGAGQIGTGELSIVNHAGGLIEATGSHKLLLAVPPNVIPGQPTFQFVNAGTLKALAGSELDIQPTLGPSIQNAGGTIAAVGAGALVAIGGVVAGGKLSSSAGGHVATLGSLATLNGLALHPVTNASSLLVAAQSPLALEGSIINTGTIAQDFDHSEIDIASPVVSLTGHGKLVLAEAPVNRLIGKQSGFTLDNVDNSIVGAGQLGLGTLTLSNEGTIKANLATGLQDNQLVVDTGVNTVVNTGLMESTNTGGLRLVSAVLNQGGTIEATGTGSHVHLDGGAIIGGTLIGTLGGTVDLLSQTKLDGLSAGSLTNAGLLEVSATQTAELLGTIVNTRTIRLDAVGGLTGQTELALRSQTVTLTGGGKVTMGDGQAMISGGDFNTLVNRDNIISGQGQVGNGVDMPIFNGGTIESLGTTTGGSTGELFLETGSDVLTNTGLLLATANTNLILSRFIANAGGTITASGNSAVVFVEDSRIEGGTLKTTAGGSIFMTIGSTLDGLNDGVLTNTGTVTIAKGVQIDLLGSITNTGSILVLPSASNGETDITLRSPIVTLSGRGRLVLNNTDSALHGDGNGELLVNNGNTISGAGTIGSADMRLSNAGHVIADSTTPLTIALASGTNAAGGVMQSTGAGGLAFASGVFSNAGVIEADQNSTVTFGASSALTNLAEGTLLGGTWKAIGGSGSATLNFINNAAVSVDAANIVLSGAGSQMTFQFGALGSATLDQTLSNITSAGALQLLAGRNFITGNTLATAGLLTLNGGTLQAPALTVAGSGHLLGFGTVQDAVDSSGRIEAQGGTLTVTGAITGSGNLQADAGATLSLTGASNTAAVVRDNGTITVGTDDSLHVTGSVDPASTGVFSLSANAILEVLADTCAGTKIDFLSGAKLVVDVAGEFGSNIGLPTYTGPLIEDFTAGDKIDLKNVLLSGASSVFDAASGLLQLSRAGANVATLHFDTASLGSGSFNLGNDGGGHILLTHA